MYLQYSALRCCVYIFDPSDFVIVSKTHKKGFYIFCVKRSIFGNHSVTDKRTAAQIIKSN